mmetsp:Transcript_6195/g.10046  ORF Transcript_6195/g.10046 Transcript_6195/m.10046 type:complete len:245 (+) Transcript_6195:1596-2330(+)
MNTSERGWPVLPIDDETKEQRWRNYHPREVWTMPPGQDPDSTPTRNHPTKSLLFSPEFGCHEESYTGHETDPRYYDTRLRVDEYSLQNSSGVLDVLLQTRRSDLFYEDPDLKVKKSYLYSLFTREAFSFSRHCELYGNFTRAEAYEVMEAALTASKQQATDSSEYKKALLIQMIVSVTLPFLVIGLLFQTTKDEIMDNHFSGKVYKLIALLFPIFLILTAFSVYSMIKLRTSANDISNHLDILK